MNDLVIKEKKLKLLDNEVVIWYIFIFLAVVNIYITGMQRKMEVTSYNENIASMIYNANMLVFIVALIIYIYFFKVNFDDYIAKKNSGSCREKENSFLTLICNILFIIAGVIVIYVEKNGENAIIPLF